MSFKPPQPVLFEEVTLNMAVGHVLYTPSMGIEGRVVKIDRKHRRVLIRFIGDPYLGGYTWWYQWEVERYIFYFADRWDTYHNPEGRNIVTELIHRWNLWTRTDMGGKALSIVLSLIVVSWVLRSGDTSSASYALMRYRNDL